MSRRALVATLADRIDAIALPHPTRVGVDGPSAAGKTTLADEIASALRERGRHVVRASIDGFHNPPEVRRRRGLLDPQGYLDDSFDLAAVARELLDPLGPGGDLSYRPAVHDLASDSARVEEHDRAAADAVLIFDGVLVLRDELAGHWDFSIYVAVSWDTVVSRGIERDLRPGVDRTDLVARYRSRYVPGQQLYVERYAPVSRADVTVMNDDPARAVLVERAERG